MKKQAYDDIEFMDFDADEVDFATIDLIEPEVDGEYHLFADGTVWKRPTKIAHCDCTGASLAAGIVLPNNYELTRAMTMQPVTPKVDDTCPYCEHTVFYRISERPNKNIASTYGRNKEKRPPKPALIAISNKRNKPQFLKKVEKKPMSEVPVLIKGASK